MKVPEGKEENWLKLERESWKPMHALRMKEGLIQSWATIAQVLPGDESNGPVYATVTTFRGMAGPDQDRLAGASAEGQPESRRERADGADGHGAKDCPHGNLASPRADRPARDGNPVETSLVPTCSGGPRCSVEVALCVSLHRPHDAATSQHTINCT